MSQPLATSKELFDITETDQELENLIQQLTDEKKELLGLLKDQTDEI